jgi:hypothetical protein
VTRYGCERGELFEGSWRREERGPYSPRHEAPTTLGWPAAVIQGSGFRRNAANPTTGSGMQQARELRAEKTVEVVQNHEGGTRLDGWCRRPEGSARATGSFWEVDTRSHVGGGAVRSRTPGEAGPMAPGQTLRHLVGSAAKARLPCGRFIGDALAGATSRVRETVRECRRRMVRHPEATPRCCPRGPRTGNGRRPRRAQERTHRPAHRDHRGLPAVLEGLRGDPDADIARRRSAGLVDHPTPQKPP